MIDWFTTFAQIVNFLILVYLLKRFLYGPVVKAMKEREEKIARQIADASRKKREAEEELDNYRKRSRELDEKREEALSGVRREAEEHRRELTEGVRREVDRMKDRWHEALRREKEAFLQDLKSRAGGQVYAVARKALADLAGADLEERMVDLFVERLPGLDEEKRRAIAASVREGESRLVIRSVGELPEAARRKIESAVKERIDEGARVEYQTSPELISGIELRAKGYKIAWSVEDYLESLESEIEEAIDEETGGKEERES